jgi:hypothetical protein
LSSRAWRWAPPQLPDRGGPVLEDIAPLRPSAASVTARTEGLTLALAGIAIGLAGALALTRLAESMLFGVSPTDPSTLAVVTVALLAVALLASWIPARRAARVNPVVALRHE